MFQYRCNGKAVWNPNQGNWMYEKIQEMQKKAAEEREKFLYEKIGFWKYLPKKILKYIFVLEQKREYGRFGPIYIDIVKNKITGKQFTLIIEGTIGK